MKTSKPMQLKIIDKIRENVEKDVDIFDGIQYLDGEGDWCDFVWLRKDDFDILEHRLKPETITINGVEIPKPLSKDHFLKIEFDRRKVYYPIPCKDLFDWAWAEKVLHFEEFLFYKTKQEAIEASKALFGIEG